MLSPVITSYLISAVLVLTILSIGLTVSVTDLCVTARRYGLLLRALLANVVLMPALAFGCYVWFGLPVEMGSGLLLFAINPGSPIGIKLAQLARGDVPTAVGLGVMLVTVSIVTTPIAARLLLPPGDHLHLSLASMIQLLVPHVVLPLVLGIGVRTLRPQWAERLTQPLQLLVNALFALVIVLVLVRDLDILATLGLETGSTMVLVALGGWLVGYVLAGKDRGRRLALAFGTSFRNSALALLMAASMGSRAVMTGVVAAVAVTLFVDLLCIVAIRWGGRKLILATKGNGS